MCNPSEDIQSTGKAVHEFAQSPMAPLSEEWSADIGWRINMEDYSTCAQQTLRRSGWADKGQSFGSCYGARDERFK